MTFALAPIGSISGIEGPAGLAGLQGLAGTTALSGTTATGGASGFGTALTGAVDNLESTQRTADALAVRAVTGDLEDVHEYTIAATEAKLTMELTAAVRNKAVDAFNEILRMQA